MHLCEKSIASTEKKTTKGTGPAADNTKVAQDYKSTNSLRLQIIISSSCTSRKKAHREAAIPLLTRRKVVFHSPLVGPLTGTRLRGVVAELFTHRIHLSSAQAISTGPL